MSPGFKRGLAGVAAVAALPFTLIALVQVACVALAPPLPALPPEPLSPRIIDALALHEGAREVHRITPWSPIKVLLDGPRAHRPSLAGSCARAVRFSSREAWPRRNRAGAAEAGTAIRISWSWSAEECFRFLAANLHFARAKGFAGACEAIFGAPCEMLNDRELFVVAHTNQDASRDPACMQRPIPVESLLPALALLPQRPYLPPPKGCGRDK